MQRTLDSENSTESKAVNPPPTSTKPKIATKQPAPKPTPPSSRSKHPARKSTAATSQPTAAEERSSKNIGPTPAKRKLEERAEPAPKKLKKKEETSAEKIQRLERDLKRIRTERDEYYVSKRQYREDAKKFEQAAAKWEVASKRRKTEAERLQKEADKANFEMGKAQEETRRYKLTNQNLMQQNSDLKQQLEMTKAELQKKRLLGTKPMAAIREFISLGQQRSLIKIGRYMMRSCSTSMHREDVKDIKNGQVKMVKINITYEGDRHFYAHIVFSRCPVKISSKSVEAVNGGYALARAVRIFVDGVEKKSPGGVLLKALCGDLKQPRELKAFSAYKIGTFWNDMESNIRKILDLNDDWNMMAEI